MYVILIWNSENNIGGSFFSLYIYIYVLYIMLIYSTYFRFVSENIRPMEEIDSYRHHKSER